MSFKSILSDIGHGLKVFFGVAETVAIAAQPFIDIAFPGVATLYNATVAEVAKAEAAAVSAGQQSGTGPQKLAMVLQAVNPMYQQYAAAQGLPAEPAQVQAWINAVVATLNAIPGKSS